MLDAALFGMPAVSAGGSFGARANAAPKTAAPAGIVRGLTVDDDGISGDIESEFHGRASLAMLQIAIVGFIVFYIWTRNVQAGG